jgi:hypothetical protein
MARAPSVAMARLAGPLAVVILAGFAAPAKADMNTTCASEIARYCADVSSGKGRISACLASMMPNLGASCRVEVQGVINGFLTPGYVRRALEPGFSAPMPPACVAPAKTLCPGLPANSARVFACLYARADRAGAACNAAATATLKGK